jgi:hypothetical protein
MASKDTYERISFDIVAAARATFESGRRKEAIELLRRFDLGKGRAVVAEALHELMVEHQRLLEQEQRAAREAIDAHLRVAEDLLEAGRIEEAWSRACDAVQLNPTHQAAIALEARIRTILDQQTARPVLRAHEEARSEPRREEAHPEPRREEARPERAEDPRADVRQETRITAADTAKKSRAWIVAVIVTLAVLLMALAVRMC